MLPWIFSILIACSGRRDKEAAEQPYDPPDDDTNTASDSVPDEDDTGDPPVDDSGEGGDDTSTPPDDSGDPEEARGWTVVDLAPLADLSSGDCPDLSESGTTTFKSSGDDRTVTVLLPDTDGDGVADTEGAPVVVFFHGLTTPSESPEPTVEMAEALDLQTVADETGAVIALPEAPVRSLFGYDFFLWLVEETESTDLVLYDDLRTCLSTELDVDLERFTAIGFSGGALFTTVVATQRADTLATFVELSGGADIEVPFFDAPFAAYNTPAWTLPGLVASGGDTDLWPSADYPLVDFEAASDTFADALVADSHFVVRCHHTAGHTITWDEYVLTITWLADHEFGEPSPFERTGLGDDSDWCTEIGD